jgi:hypothetical protein
MRLPPGQHVVLRADGTEEYILSKPTIEGVRKQIGCKYLDSVTLTLKDGSPRLVMLIDDEGLRRSRPPNRKATNLRLQMNPPVPHVTLPPIVGDVVLVNAMDFSNQKLIAPVSVSV